MSRTTNGMDRKKRLHKYKMHTNQAGATAYAQIRGDEFWLALGRGRQAGVRLEPNVTTRPCTACVRYVYVCMGTLPPAAMRHLMHNSEKPIYTAVASTPPAKDIACGRWIST